MSRGTREARARNGTSPFLPSREDVIRERDAMRAAGLTRAELTYPVGVRQLWEGDAARRVDAQSLDRKDVLRARDSFTSRHETCFRLYVGRGGYDELRTSDEWRCLFDPVNDYDSLVRGRVGTLLGLQVLTDAFEDRPFIGARCWVA